VKIKLNKIKVSPTMIYDNSIFTFQLDLMFRFTNILADEIIGYYSTFNVLPGYCPGYSYPPKRTKQFKVMNKQIIVYFSNGQKVIVK